MPSIGRSLKKAELTLWDTSLLSVFSNGAASVTVTSSVFEPTSRPMSSRNV